MNLKHQHLPELVCETCGCVFALSSGFRLRWNLSGTMTTNGDAKASSCHVFSVGSVQSGCFSICGSCWFSPVGFGFVHAVVQLCRCADFLLPVAMKFFCFVEDAAASCMVSLWLSVCFCKLITQNYKKKKIIFSFPVICWRFVCFALYMIKRKC